MRRPGFLRRSSLRRLDSDAFKPIRLPVLAEYMAGVHRREVTEILTRSPGTLSPEDVPQFWLLYATKRVLELGVKVDGPEGLWAMANRPVRQVRTEAKAKEAAKLFFDAIGEHLTPESDRMALALRLISLPEVRNLLAEQFGMNFTAPAGHTISFEELVRLHPETRALYEPPPPLIFSPRQALAREIDPSRQGFNDLTFKAFAMQRMRERLAENIEVLQAVFPEGQGLLAKLFFARRYLPSVARDGRLRSALAAAHSANSHLASLAELAQMIKSVESDS